MEYINYPMRWSKRRYSSWKEIKVDPIDDEIQVEYRKIFIIANEYIEENFIWNKENKRPFITQECFNSFINKVMDKNIILLDATYENYQFLRGVYGQEYFKDLRACGEDLLARYEQEYILRQQRLTNKKFL